MPDMDPSLASWAQAGGVVAFAGAVLLQLRDFRRELGPLFKSIGETLAEVKATMAALLERERTRAERLAAQDAARRASSRTPSGGAPVADWEDEETHPIALPLRSPGLHGPSRPPRGGG